MRAEMTLDGRTALVTGGARGIGRACAIRLAEAGAAVTLLDRAEAEVQALAAELGARAVVADLSDVDTLDRLGLTERVSQRTTQAASLTRHHSDCQSWQLIQVSVVLTAWMTMPAKAPLTRMGRVSNQRVAPRS